MCIVIVVYYSMSKHMPVPVCDGSLAEIAGSNTAGDKDVCLL